MVYQLSHWNMLKIAPIKSDFISSWVWWLQEKFLHLHRELNPWPSDYELDGLPTELLKHVEDCTNWEWLYFFQGMMIARKYFSPSLGVEPLTFRLWAWCSANWAIGTWWKFDSFATPYCMENVELLNRNSLLDWSVILSFFHQPIRWDEHWVKNSWFLAKAMPFRYNQRCR